VGVACISDLEFESGDEGVVVEELHVAAERRGGDNPEQAPGEPPVGLKLVVAALKRINRKKGPRRIRETEQNKTGQEEESREEKQGKTLK
jgi:hypothetical protein